MHKKLLRNYTNLVKKYGYDPKSLGWGNKKGKQSIRFEILCQIGDLSNCSVLDVGCGFGDLYKYLKFRKTQVKYFGVDINSDILEVGKKNYPGIKVELRDIQRKKFTRKFDWVIASGVAAHCPNYKEFESILAEMFRICKKGIAINFVSDQVDFKTKGLFNSTPEKVYSIAKKSSEIIEQIVKRIEGSS